jgi:hypothetical protein
VKYFILRFFSFFSFPILIITFIIFLYIKLDVYLDFGYHKNYSWKYHFQQLGDISTKKILKSSINYNSFIFGSSRTVDVYACYLQKKIKNSRFFHYANWGETIGGIYAKLKLLDSLGYRLDNIIIYFDTDHTFANDGKCQSSDHYLLTHENKYKYFYIHFRSFFSSLDYDKIKILLGYKVNGKIFPNWESDIVTNDSRHTCSDILLNNYGVKKSGKIFFTKIDSLKKCGFLYQRNKFQKFKEKQISLYEKNILIKIKDILEKHKSKYYIVITPLYDQLKFNTSDMQIIDKIFDKNVYDFSGINYITNNVYNYPDRGHFQAYISKNIIDSIILCRQ